VASYKENIENGRKKESENMIYEIYGMQYFIIGVR